MKFIKNALLSCFFVVSMMAQEAPLLTKQQALQETLAKNFDIQLVENTIEIADNNQDLLNSGYLPTLIGNAGASYDLQDQQATFQNGETNTIDGAETQRFNASLNLNYTLFDGLGRYYNYKALKEQYALTELQARETIETTMLQLFTVYYEVARLTENVTVLKETFENTKKRLTRAQYAFDYGQNNKLEVLNAEVDIVTDSTNLLNTLQLLRNTKRDLNVISNTDLQRRFVVDTSVQFIAPLQLDAFIEDAEKNNVRLLQAEKNKTISDYNVKQSRAVFLPSLGLTGSYGWNQGEFPVTSFLASNQSVGFSAGLNLTWNLFDGGTSITNIKNAKITLQNQEIQQAQFKNEVRRDIANAQDEYINRLAVFELQGQNVVTAQNNFERSNEQYKVGQIASVELRQAQINLLNAETNKNAAKYQAKLAELQVLQLVGQLLNVDF